MNNKYFIHTNNIKTILENNGYKFDCTKMTAKDNHSHIKAEDFYSFDEQLNCTGAIIQLTDKNNVKNQYNIIVDCLHFYLSELNIDFSDPRNPESEYILKHDFSNQWIELMATKYPRYLTATSAYLNKEDYNLRNKYMTYYNDNTIDRTECKIKLMVYKDSINTVEKQLDILNKVAMQNTLQN